MKDAVQIFTGNHGNLQLHIPLFMFLLLLMGYGIDFNPSWYCSHMMTLLVYNLVLIWTYFQFSIIQCTFVKSSQMDILLMIHMYTGKWSLLIYRPEHNTGTRCPC